MTEFIQGAYNKYEHDYTERTDEQLQSQLEARHVQLREIPYTGERRAQIMRDITNLAFELAERERERKDQDIETAWREHELVKG